MGNFREQLNLLESAVAIKFSELLNANPKTKFLTLKEVMDNDYDDYFDVRSDITGETFEVIIMGVYEKGIKIYNTGSGEMYHIGLHDLASLEDKISLVELMEIKMKEL